MANEMKPVFFESEPGWTFSVNVNIHTGTGFGDITLSDFDPVIPDQRQQGTHFVSQIPVSSPGCVSFTRVTAATDLTADVIYKITDNAGSVRSTIIHKFDDSTPLAAGTFYSAVGFVST